MADFNFQNLLDSQPFMFGMNLLGQSRNPNAMSNATRALHEMQQAKALQAQQQALLEQKQLEDATKARAIALQEAQLQDTMERRRKMDKLLESRFPGVFGEPAAAPTPEAPSENGPPPNPNFQPNPFNGFPPADTDRVGFRPANMQRAQATQAPSQYEAVNPDAVVFDYAMNGGKNIGKFYQEATNPIVTKDGAVLLPQKDGTYKIAGGSLEAQQAIERMREATKAEQDPTTIVLDNGQSIEVTRLQKSNFLNSGTLPSQVAQRLGTPASGAAPASEGVSDNNFGNLRPVGATKGFQQFATPEQGLAALDKDLAAKGKRGLNTISKILNVYAPPSENDTPAYIASVSKRLGVEPNTPLDMNNAAVRQVLGSAMILHEKGGIKGLKGIGLQGQDSPANSIPQKTPARQPRLGVTQAPEVAAQRKQVSEQWGKWHIDMQKASVKASGRESRMKLLESYLNKIDTGVQAPTVLGLQKFAAAAGFQIPKSASYAEAATGLAKNLAMELRDSSEGGGLPGQMSNYEDRLLQSMIANIDKLPGANKILAKAYLRQQDRIKAVAKMMNDYTKENGVLDEGVMDRIATYKDANPLFDEEAVTQSAPAVKGLGTNRVEGRITGPGYNPSAAPKFLGFE